jgi:pSer/pThr/pTyr-binding forkhead associated (FHA) protein
MPGAGTFFCVQCGSHLSLQEDDRLPGCPRCGGSTFRLDSIFESRQERGETTAEVPIPPTLTPPDWLEDARTGLPGHGRYLVSSDDGEIRTFTIDYGWTRIGRSVAADLRLDHPSVSRRHALIVSEAHRMLRVLDDRSLNGVLINGEPVEWGKLEDGDVLTIGRYQLFTLEA